MVLVASETQIGSLNNKIYIELCALFKSRLNAWRRDYQYTSQWRKSAFNSIFKDPSGTLKIAAVFSADRGATGRH